MEENKVKLQRKNILEHNQQWYKIIFKKNKNKNLQQYKDFTYNQYWLKKNNTRYLLFPMAYDFLLLFYSSSRIYFGSRVAPNIVVALLFFDESNAFWNLWLLNNKKEEKEIHHVISYT